VFVCFPELDECKISLWSMFWQNGVAINPKHLVTQLSITSENMHHDVQLEFWTKKIVDFSLLKACLSSVDIGKTLEVSHIMRSINVRYLLTYYQLLTRVLIYHKHGICGI